MAAHESHAHFALHWHPGHRNRRLAVSFLLRGKAQRAEGFFSLVRAIVVSAVVASHETTTEPLAGEAGEQSGAFSGKFFIRLVAFSITRQVRPQSIQE